MKLDDPKITQMKLVGATNKEPQFYGIGTKTSYLFHDPDFPKTISIISSKSSPKLVDDERWRETKRRLRSLGPGDLLEGWAILNEEINGLHRSGAILYIYACIYFVILNPRKELKEE